MKKQKLTYTYRGRVKSDDGWCDGFSPDRDGLPTYPWLTRAQCIRDAKSKGGKAQFSGPGAKRFEPEIA